MERHRIADLVDFIVQSVEHARAVNEPFHHLVFPRVFPDDIYHQMLARMPTAADYRPMSGRAKESILDDGTSTRVKLDLLPEHLDCLPEHPRQLWQGIGHALCATEVQQAVVRRLAPGLQRRFGDTYREMRLFPVPALFRDTPGYFIPPHTDTHWKGITVQFYLPCDDRAAHVGTVFHRTLPDGRKEPATQMTFAPNSGYAFAVGDDTWHSVDVVGPEVTSRDSILLTYYVDAGWLRYVRNRGKRLGNLLQYRMTQALRHVA
jgi:hypothetical protein